VAETKPYDSLLERMYVLRCPGLDCAGAGQAKPSGAVGSHGSPQVWRGDAQRQWAGEQRAQVNCVQEEGVGGCGRTLE
jgi:hypothetical protein